MNIEDKFIVYSDPFVNDKNQFDIKYNKIEKIPEKGQLYNHQEFAKLYMKNNDRVLVISKPGTGKSCTAIGVSEYFSDIYFNDVKLARIKNCIILTRGKTLAKNFENEILNVCTKKGKYTLDENITGQSRKVRKARLLSRFYTFKNFQSFANELREMSEKDILESFSKTLFIVDEVQNIPLESGKSGLYETYHNLFNLLQTSKIMLLSATPIVNDPKEFVQIMNLILPKEKKFDEKKIKWNSITIDDFKNIQGYILFSEKFEALPKIQYEELLENPYLETKNNLNIYNIYDEASATVITDYDLIHYSVSGCIMCGKQREVYYEEVAKNLPQSQLGNAKDNKVSEIGDFYLKPLEISNFVYPDYMDKMKNEQINPFGKSAYNFYFGDLESDSTTQLGRIQKEEGNNRRKFLKEELQKNLYLYSTKYHRAIEHIKYLKREGKYEKAFFYHTLVEGSGLLIFSKCLEYVLGFKEFDAKREVTSRTFDNLEKADRYFILTSTTTKGEIENVLKIYNHPKNIHGEYLKYILGSKVTSEGLSFYNTPDVYLLSVPWNLPSEYQSINRILRIGSFNKLLEEGDVDVGIHRFVSYFSTINDEDPNTELEWEYSMIKVDDDYRLSKTAERPDENDDSWHSIEIYIYQLAIRKEKNIAKVMKIAKQYASDCINGKNRNILDKTFDYTYDCNFDKCEYECVPLNEAIYKDDDYSKYMNDSTLIDNIIPILKSLFSMNYKLDIQSLLYILSEKLNKNFISIIFAINDMIISQFTFNDNQGYLRYIFYKNGFLLLGDKSDDDFHCIENIFINNPINIFKEIKEIPNYEKYEKQYENINLKEISFDDRLNLKTPLRWFFNIDIVVKLSKKKQILEEKRYNIDVNIIPIVDYEKIMLTNYIYNFYSVNGPIRFKLENKWMTATSDNEYKDIWKSIKNSLSEIIIKWINTYRPNSPIEYQSGNSNIISPDNKKDLIYGFITPQNNFIIANIDRNTQTYKNLIIGKMCKSLNSKEIKEIYTKLEIELDVNSSITGLCNNLLKYLFENNKIFDLRY